MKLTTTGLIIEALLKDQATVVVLPISIKIYLQAREDHTCGKINPRRTRAVSFRSEFLIRPYELDMLTRSY